jgi:ABC-type amino acid transport substrate-binding protein
MIVPSNQNYDQMTQAVANNVYDVIVGDVTITAKRRTIADFSNSIFDTSLRIILRQGSVVSVNLLSYLRPFAPSLWLVILGALLYASALMLLLERRENEALKQKSIVSSAAMSVWYTYGTMVGYGVDFHVQTAAGRLLTMGLYMLSIILVASYTANLASDLTVSKSTNIISGIDDIKNGKIPFSRIGIIVGSSIEDYYLREISGGSRNYYPLKSQSDIYSCLLNNTIDASIYDTGLLEYATNEIYCNLTLVGSDFEPSAHAIVMRKDWIYAETLDISILALRESGDLDTLKIKWFDVSSCSDSSSDTGTSYKIESLAGLFVIFAMISILSLLLFAWLKRFIIKDYLCKLAHEKHLLAQQNISDERLPKENFNEPSQTYQIGLDSPLVVHF